MVGVSAETIKSEVGKLKGQVPDSIVHELQSSLLRVSKDRAITREQLGEIIKNVKEAYLNAIVEPGEAVGTVAAQSIGEPGTQMSIPSGEKVIVKVGGNIRPVKIGEFVDDLMETHGVKKVGESEVCCLPPNTEIEVPSLNQDGKIRWKKLISCSRHTCSKKLLCLKTRSGRKIIATDNHSFVVRKDNRVVPILGKKLRLGDRIPVIKNLPSTKPREFLEANEYLPRNPYWYGSEFKKALPLHGNSGSFQVSYPVPVGPEPLQDRINGESSFDIQEDFVYPYQIRSKSKIPEQVELDSTLGWFIGAYLSGGHVSKYTVNISNTDEVFLSKARKFSKKFGINFSEKDNPRGFARGHGLNIRSKVLADFVRKTCGEGSSGKKVPDFAYSADETFIGSLLRAYFDGDGNVSVGRRVIRASSRSKELIDGLALLLAEMGIFVTKKSNGREHSISISYKYAKTFKEKIGFDTPEKARRLEELCEVQKKKTSYDVVEMVPGFGELFKNLSKKVGLPSRLTNNFTKRQRVSRATLEKYVNIFESIARRKNVDIGEELALMKRMLDEDVVWDEIVEIQHINPPSEKVYDFSVDELETFATFDGVITHNTLRTFHYAGVAELNVTLGLPRIIEIIDARKTPSAPLMRIYLKEKFAKSKEKAREFAQKIELTTVEDVSLQTEVDLINTVFIVTLNRSAMQRRGLTPTKVASTIKDALKIDVHVDGYKLRMKPTTMSLSELRKLASRVRNLTLRGLKGITRVLVKMEGNEYVVYTEGSNLVEVITMPEVDPTRTVTNNIHEIEEVLGIEAARNAIINEAVKTLEEQGLEVDLRHIMLVADMMTASGEVMQVGRHGVSGEKASVLARASFEITTKHLLDACIHGERDRLDGIIENVIAGQPIPLGTGSVELVMGREEKSGAK